MVFVIAEQLLCMVTCYFQTSNPHVFGVLLAMKDKLEEEFRVVAQEQQDQQWVIIYVWFYQLKVDKSMCPKHHEEWGQQLTSPAYAPEGSM